MNGWDGEPALASDKSDTNGGSLKETSKTDQTDR
jgi:hypothetical protein